MGRARRASEDTWWEDEAVEVPRDGTPDMLQRERRFAFVRRWTRISLFGLPVVIILATLGLMAAMSASPVVPDAYTSETRAVAQVSLERWLGGDPAPLPGGWVAGWESSTQAPSKTPQSENEIISLVVVHRFTVADANDSLYTAEVAVQVNPETGASVAGSPSLSPQAPSANDGATLSTWGDLPSTSVTEGMKTAVQVWAEAFLSGDPAKLRQAVGDPDVNRSYTPMTGTSFVSVNVDGAAALWDDPDGDHSSQAQPPKALARVSLGYVWGPVSETSPTAALMQFDVLILDADTASPRVVAWGGVGSGQLLVAYSNSTSGRQVAPAPTLTPTPTPSQTGPAAVQPDPAATSGTPTGTSTNTSPEPSPEADTASSGTAGTDTNTDQGAGEEGVD